MANERNCTLCGAGKYQTGQGMVSEVNCTNCQAGSYQTGSGMANSSLCITCSVCTGALNFIGSECTSTADTGCTACRACPAGKYEISSCVGNLEAKCEVCRPGTYSTGLGAKDSSECLRCPAGTYQTGIGMVDIHNCTICPKGKYHIDFGVVNVTSCKDFTTPFSDVHLAYTEIEMNNGRTKAQLTWIAPSNTG